jgi:glyoxylase-like metal-dependent hydrolase (beta-lactamase superfamily II)
MNPVPRRISSVVFVLVLATAFLAYLAPYVYPEYQFRIYGKDASVLPRPTVPVAGRWFDDYFVVEEIDATTFAIGEPRYYWGNYSYLIIGQSKAILFDAGTGTRDIVPVVRSLTRMPVTVIPSHLHYDHVGAVGRFERTALLDSPALRARSHNSLLTLERYEFLGFIQDLAPPTLRVDEWWPADSTVDLGNRRIRVVATPGHTPSSVSLYDEQRRQAFVGDFVYPSTLYAFYPGASRSTYLATTRQLLALLDPESRIYTAHMADPPAPVRAPVLARADLQDLEQTLRAIEQHAIRPIPSADLKPVLSFPRVFPVRGSMTFATGYVWNNR